MAYQGSGRGIRLDLIDALHGLENLAIQPDLTILFDIEEDTALKRARARDHGRSNDETRFEQESLAFHRRVRSGYLDMARQEPGRFVVVDARGTVEEVHHRVVESMDRFLTTREAPE